jgi:hypothetical protein
MMHYIAGGLAIATAVLGLMVWGQHESLKLAQAREEAANQRYQQAHKAWKAAERTTESLRVRNRKLQLEGVEAREALERELAASAADWAKQEVPEAVKRALR